MIFKMNRNRNSFRARSSWNWAIESASFFPGEKNSHTEPKRKNQEEVGHETAKLDGSSEHGFHRKATVFPPLRLLQQRRRSADKTNRSRTELSATVRTSFL